MRRMEKRKSIGRQLVRIALAAFLGYPLQAQETPVFELDPVVAHANRVEPLALATLPSPLSLTADDLRSGQFKDITAALSSHSSFAPFRRTHAQAAHPTTQGIRLRNLGPNASSRTLLVYDGVPQNDPFGGWLYWHQFNLSQVERISIFPSGSGEVWGNFGAGGLISILSDSPSPNSSRIDVELGAAQSLELRAANSMELDQNLVLDLGARTFATDGFHPLRADQRGPVDRKASSASQSINARIRWSPTENWQTRTAIRFFDESRDNGTPLARNETEALNLSLLADRRFPAANSHLNIALYHQDRQFQNVFTSVASDRASEIPALDQYDVPAQASGGAITYSTDSSLDLAFTGGLDFRQTSGEVRERFRNLGSGFTRNRVAGGEQRFAGAFATLAKSLSDKDQLSLATRLDSVENRDGRRLEMDATNGSVLDDQKHSRSSDTVFSSNLRWRHHFSDTLTGSATFFQGFRSPTLNELYRPFRVRNDITEANPNLVNERQQGAELALSARPSETTHLRLVAYHYRLEEIIANVLVTREPGFDPQFGFIPPGGSGSRRSNLDRSRVFGFELQSKIDFSETISIEADLAYSQSEVRTDEFTELAGKEFPQSAPLQLRLGVDWSPRERLTIGARYRYSGRAYESLQNVRRIEESDTVSLFASFQLDPSHQLTLSIDNAFDAEVVSGIASNGLVTVDAPRELRLAWSWKN